MPTPPPPADPGPAAHEDTTPDGAKLHAAIDGAIERLDAALARHDSAVALAGGAPEAAERDAPLPVGELVSEWMRRDREQLRPETERIGELEDLLRDELADLGRWAGELGVSYEKSLPIAQKLIWDSWGEDSKLCPFETLLDSWGMAYDRGLARREAKLLRKLNRVSSRLARHHRRRRERREPQQHAAVCNAGRTRRRATPGRTKTASGRSSRGSPDPGEPGSQADSRRQPRLLAEVFADLGIPDSLRRRAEP